MPSGSSARSSSVTTTAPGGRGNAPTHTPDSRARTRTAPAPAKTSPGRRARGDAAAVRAPGAVVVMELPASALERLRHGFGEVGDPRAPAGGDVVVGLQDAPLLDRRHGVEGGPLRDRLRRLLAALGVGQDDEVRRLAHDVLRR